MPYGKADLFPAGGLEHIEPISTFPPYQSSWFSSGHVTEASPMRIEVKAFAINTEKKFSLSLSLPPSPSLPVSFHGLKDSRLSVTTAESDHKKTLMLRKAGLRDGGKNVVLAFEPHDQTKLEISSTSGPYSHTGQ